MVTRLLLSVNGCVRNIVCWPKTSKIRTLNDCPNCTPQLLHWRATLASNALLGKSRTRSSTSDFGYKISPSRTTFYLQILIYYMQYWGMPSCVRRSRLQSIQWSARTFEPQFANDHRRGWELDSDATSHEIFAQSVPRRSIRQAVSTSPFASVRKYLPN